MSRTAEISLPFGTEERVFRLGLGELRAVQEKCDAGPGELAQRLAPFVRALRAGLSFSDIMAGQMMGSARVDDIREVLLQGLIGGGMGATEAGVLVRANYDPRPLDPQFAVLAFSILTEGYLPPEDEPPGETQAAKAKPRRRSQKAKSTTAA